MDTRQCKVRHGGQFVEAKFHKFGNEIVYGSDNEPREKTVAVVELPDGKVRHFDPEKIEFLDSDES